MDIASVMDIGRQALFTVVLVSSPMLGLGLLVGLVASLLASWLAGLDSNLQFAERMMETSLLAIVL